MICTRPARRAGRGRGLRQTPIQQAGNRLGIEIFTPERLDANAANKIHAVDADAFVVAAYGRMIPHQLLEATELGAINVHPSLLPRYRGPSPVVSAILNGDSCTGVSIILLDAGMDTGPLLMQSKRMPIQADERADTLTSRLFATGAEMLPKALFGIAHGDLEPQHQDDASASIAKLVQKSDGEIDWNLSADRIERMMRAYHPWPGIFTKMKGEQLKLLSLRKGIAETPLTNDQPGLVSIDDQGQLVALAGDREWLALEKLQLAGRKPLPGPEFLRGLPGIVGTVLGS